MSQLIIHGFPPSTYVWTARAVCAVKGVDYHLDVTPPAQVKSEAYLKEIHPFGKVPAMTHGDVHLFETLAIALYVDNAFEGPALQPTDPAALGKMGQWLSVANAYFYNQVVPAYVFEYIFPKGEGGAVRQDRVDAALPAITRSVGLMNDALEEGPYFTGSQLTLAELFMGPLLFSLANLPEGKQIVGAHPNVGRLLSSLSEVSPFMASAPTR